MRPEEFCYLRITGHYSIASIERKERANNYLEALYLGLRSPNILRRLGEVNASRFDATSPILLLAGINHLRCHLLTPPTI